MIYRFYIRYNLGSQVWLGEGHSHEAYDYVPTPNDTIILQLAAENWPWTSGLANFVRSTSASRAALATSSESRQVALELLPHCIPFRDLPRGWTNRGSDYDDPVDGSNYPEHVLRFNGARDIIVFQYAMWDEQNAVVKICELQNRVPDAFLHMEHVGISLRSFARGHSLAGPMHGGSYGVSPPRCNCSTEVCHGGACQYEPLPRFLACFPSLKAFYIARVSPDAEDNEDQPDGKPTAVENADCHCGPGTDGALSGEPRHEWPIIKSSDLDRWCVVYDERTGCFPEIHLMSYVRQHWRANFPYYRQMEHLDIKFVRRMDPGGIRDDVSVHARG
jgi:hypothetical protein